MSNHNFQALTARVIALKRELADDPRDSETRMMLMAALDQLARLTRPVGSVRGTRRRRHVWRAEVVDRIGRIGSRSSRSDRADRKWK
jgi:hypothetical protein